MGELSKYFDHNAMLLDDLTVGDLIEFPRGPYSHWAVYVGNGKVAHLAGLDNDGLDAEIKPELMFTICGVKFNKAKVCRDDFWKVAGDSKARKNNKNDTKWSPLESSEIAERALRKLGEVGYNLVYSNCEHFAKWCRYGISKSDQVDTVITGASVGFAAALAVGAVYALAKFFNSDKEEEEEEEKMKTKR